MAVGGDYQPDADSKTTAVVSRNDGLSWQLVAQQPRAFVSAVCIVESQTQSHLIATGPTQSYYSNDGNYWEPFSAVGFHAMDGTPTGKIFAVGSSGRFGELKLIE